MCLKFSYGGNLYEQKVRRWAPRSLLWWATSTWSSLRSWHWRQTDQTQAVEEVCWWHFLLLSAHKPKDLLDACVACWWYFLHPQERLQTIQLGVDRRWSGCIHQAIYKQSWKWLNTIKTYKSVLSQLQTQMHAACTCTNPQLTSRFLPQNTLATCWSQGSIG